MWSLAFIVFPLLAALFVLVLPRPRAAGYVAFGASLSLLAYTLFVACIQGSADPEKFSLWHPWLPEWGVNFLLRMDGISFLMILLTNLLMPFILFTGLHRRQRHENLRNALILFTQFALNGVFLVQNAILFYIFWEVALIPVFFLLFLFGGERRQSVTLKFFIYSIFGSIFLLIAFIYLYFQTVSPHSFDYQAFRNLPLEPCNQFWIFWMLLLSFLIKIPLFPLHSWQPDTYTVAPWQGSMILGGLLMKMGIYGLIRWVIPVMPAFSLQWGYWIVILALAGMIVFSIIALYQHNLKTFIAFSSLAHGGLMGAAVFSLNDYALQGALFQSFSHGIIIVLLFYMAQLIEERTETLNMARLGGIKNIAPRFSAMLLVTVLASVGLPLTNGFTGELLMILGLYAFNGWAAILGSLTLVLGAVYMLYFFQRIALGGVNPVTAGFADLSPREMIVILPLVALVLIFGIYPQPLLNLTDGPVRELINLAFSVK